MAEQLTFFPLHHRAVVSEDVIDVLKESIVSVGKTSSEMTLKMNYLDPDNTRSQTIGTYLRDNFTSRLEAALLHNDASSLRARVKGQQFKLCFDSKDGIVYSFPVHRCGPDYAPKGGKALKNDVRSSAHQQSMLQQQPRGLFIGIIYHEEKGLLQIFLGQLFPGGKKNKYATELISMLYSKSMDLIDAKKITDHKTEEISVPVVKLRTV